MEHVSIVHGYPGAGGLSSVRIRRLLRFTLSPTFADASTVHGSRVKGAKAIADAFDVTNTKLAAKTSEEQWAIGRFSIADIHLFRVFWRFRSSIDAAPGTYPALEAHHDHMLARLSVQKAIEIEKSYE